MYAEKSLLGKFVKGLSGNRAVFLRLSRTFEQCRHHRLGVCNHCSLFC